MKYIHRHDSTYVCILSCFYIAIEDSDTTITKTETILVKVNTLWYITKSLTYYTSKIVGMAVASIIPT